MKKVASYLTLFNVDYWMFRNWLLTLPVDTKEKNVRLLWKKAEDKKAVIWMSQGGFKFFKYSEVEQQ